MFAQIEMTRNKNRLFSRHFETVQHLFFFFRIVIFYSPYVYGANFIAKFWWESGFLGGFHGTPLGTNGSESTLITWVKSVQAFECKIYGSSIVFMKVYLFLSAHDYTVD